MKRLLLCRHAKSSWKDMSLRDIDRPLNKRGKRDAPEMGRRLAEAGLKPDMIMSSPARRAMNTARQIARQLEYKKKEIIQLEALYGVSADRFLQIIQGLNDDVSLVIMVGHNPETTVLANILGDLDIDNVPTCGIVALDFDVVSWLKVGKCKGKLVFFDYPRKGGIEKKD